MKSDIVIVGGGIIGLYSAYLLALQGIKPILIDRGEFGQESTWAAGGILIPLLPWNYELETLYLTHNAVDAYQNLSHTLLKTTNIDIEFWNCGITIITSKLQPIKKWCDSNHYLYNSCSSDLTTIQLPNAAQIRSPKLIQGLVKQLELLGVTLLNNTNVVDCHIRDNKITGVYTSTELIETSTLIWTTGAWSTNISTQDLPIESPNIRPIKGQVITLEDCSVNLKTILYKDGHYLIPRKDGVILAGSTLEDVGFENSPTKTANSLLWQRSIEMLPELINSKITHHWSGLRPGSTKNIPTIGPHPTIEGLYFNCGHYRYGITMAPKSCEILVDWILTKGSNLSKQDISYTEFN